MGVIPIVNENDTLAVAEIKFGDNDTLSAITAAMIHADYLFLMTDVDCLYDKNPRTNANAKAIEVVQDISALQADGEFPCGRFFSLYVLKWVLSLHCRLFSWHRRHVHKDRGCEASNFGGSHHSHHKIIHAWKYY